MADPGPVVLGPARLAVAWCDYLEAHARRLYASADADAIESALALAERIKAGKLPSPFVLRDVYRNGWRELGTPDEARAAVAALEDRGWVRTVESHNTGGAPERTSISTPSYPAGGTCKRATPLGRVLTEPTKAPPRRPAAEVLSVLSVAPEAESGRNGTAAE